MTSTFSDRFGSTQIGQDGFGSIPADSIRFDSIRFGSVRTGSVRFPSIRFGSIRFGPVRFGPVRLVSVPIRFRFGSDSVVFRPHLCAANGKRLLLIGKTVLPYERPINTRGSSRRGGADTHAIAWPQSYDQGGGGREGHECSTTKTPRAQLQQRETRHHRPSTTFFLFFVFPIIGGKKEEGSIVRSLQRSLENRST